MYDLIIIGAGPAGITAALYAARKRMNFLVISDDIGGQMTWSGDIENYTGYQFVTGTDLVAKFEEHMQKYDVPLKESERVIELRPNDTNSGVFIRTNKGTIYSAKTAIIASGKRSRELNVPGEAEFRKKGVTYCATCDGPLFAHKDVAVIGGGNSGLEAVLQLMVIARHIYLINVTGELTGDAILQEKIMGSDKVTILNNSRVTSIFGSTMVERISVATDEKETTLPVSGVFVEIGLIPNSEFTRLIEKNKWNEIVVNNRNETNVPYVFAAGDVTDVPEKQIIIAAGEGSKALLSAYNYLAYLK
jgi:alkyl hydroperoxide reductase subunit F